MLKSTTLLQQMLPENMYAKTPFRLAMIPDTTYVDNFKYSPDPTWKKIYEERIEPHLDRYKPYGRRLNELLMDGKNPDVGAVFELLTHPLRYKEYKECKLVVSRKCVQCLTRLNIVWSAASLHRFKYMCTPRLNTV